MHEQDKLNEARHYLGKMKDGICDPKTFKFYLSAFLSSARSVLQYARKEAKSKPGGQNWYMVNTCGKVVTFLKHKRNANIHEQPINPTANVNITIREVISPAMMLESVSIYTIDQQGNRMKKGEAKPERHMVSEIEPAEVSVKYEYFFADWPPTQDVVSLCSIYLAELNTIIDDGRSKGFLSSAPPTLIV